MKERNATTRICLRSFAAVALLTVCIVLVAGCLVHAGAQSAPTRADNLKKFLQKYDGNPSSPTTDCDLPGIS
jgi:hypothetical protein